MNDNFTKFCYIRLWYVHAHVIVSVKCLMSRAVLFCHMEIIAFYDDALYKRIFTYLFIYLLT